MNLEDKIRQYLDDNGVFYTERANSFSLNCPNCSRQKLDIAKEEGNYICYYCADVIKGPAPEPILSELTGDSISQVKRFLRGFESLKSLNTDFLNTNQIQFKKEEEETDEKRIPYYFVPIGHPIAKDGLEYLDQKRGIPEFLALELGLMYNSKHKQVVFPVYDGPHYVGYQSRAIYGKLKYNDVEKSNFLMFENTIVDDKVILCEGPISALKFAKTGIGYVAIMGKSISEKQIDKLTKLGITTIYLGLDRDAYKEIQTFYDKWHTKFKIFLLEVPSHRGDFGDCTFDECLNVYQNAIPLNRMSFLPDII